MPETPSNIGKYKITRALGKGAMGMVYEGFDPVIERKVAIKTILSEYLDAAEMEEAVARFKREAQAAGRLQHPGIVGVFEYGNDADMAFIVMEYVEGQELKAALQKGHRFEVIEIFEIMKQLLTALDYSHKQGVVHRDIKPANVMLMPGPKVKIMDFGIARLESSSLTQAGTVVGTPTHMAPEQLMGIPADGRADLWSTGVILYELLTGASPFLAETPAAVMHNVLQAEPAPPSSLNPAIPRGFDGVVARALAKKADDRFRTAREFQAALLMALQGKSVSATMTLKTQTAMRAPEPVPVLAVAPEALAEIERSLSRHVGPLAKVLIRKSRAEATSFDEFFHLLAEQIPNAEEQKAFLKKVAALKPTSKVPAASPEAPPAPASVGATAKSRPQFTPEVLAQAEKRLASYVGPLARLLIKEAAGNSGNLRELYSQLAAHIDSEDERRDFLASLPR
ncbi:MAG TPA: serine/threonine-protein kinase [Usitatibacter sp.]|nr:serine/threonine-protein kinase [Usitatibacter sp.]